MGEVIQLRDRIQKAPTNLITARPWEFRRALWSTPTFEQMLRSHSAEFEKERLEREGRGRKELERVPPCTHLDGGRAYTIRAVYGHRKDEKRMREVYYLTGLLDCLINQVNPILRTDLLRDMYNKIFTMKKDLMVNWYGPLDQVLLPIDPWLYNELEYRSVVSKAQTMKDLYQAIRSGTDEMFDVLSLEYVFYCPNLGGQG